MILKERAGKYKGATEVKVLLIPMEVRIEVNIHEDGSVNASYSSKLKGGSTTLYLDPEMESNSVDINISGVHVHTVFNENKSINVTLPKEISGCHVSHTNVTLERC